MKQAPKKNHFQPRSPEYEDFILRLLLEETDNKIKDPIGLVMYLTYRYHPDFQKNKSRGRQARWNPLIKAMLAVQIDALLEQGIKSRAEAVNNLVIDRIWSKMRPEYNPAPESGIDQFVKVDKQIRHKDADLYEKVKKIYQKYAAAGNLKGWRSLVSKTIKLQLTDGT